MVSADTISEMQSILNKSDVIQAIWGIPLFCFEALFYELLLILILSILYWTWWTWQWIPSQDRGDIYGIIRKIINTIIYQYDCRYNEDKLWSNAFKTAFARDFDYNSNRCWALPEHNCTGGGGIYMLPCGHFYCRDCLYNHYYHNALKWWGNNRYYPLTPSEEYFGIFSCPQQECRQNYSCYITWGGMFWSFVKCWESLKAFPKNMRRNKHLLISGYLREAEEEDYQQMGIPTVIKRCINKTYTKFYMKPSSGSYVRHEYFQRKVTKI